MFSNLLLFLFVFLFFYIILYIFFYMTFIFLALVIKIYHFFFMRFLLFFARKSNACFFLWIACFFWMWIQILFIFIPFLVVLAFFIHFMILILTSMLIFLPCLIFLSSATLITGILDFFIIVLGFDSFLVYLIVFLSFLALFGVFFYKSWLPVIRYSKIKSIAFSSSDLNAISNLPAKPESFLYEIFSLDYIGMRTIADLLVDIYDWVLNAMCFGKQAVCIFFLIICNRLNSSYLFNFICGKLKFIYRILRLVFIWLKLRLKKNFFYIWLSNKILYFYYFFSSRS